MTEKLAHPAFDCGGPSARSDQPTWREILGRWLYICPHCGIGFLIVGKSEGDSHLCKHCGAHSKVGEGRTP